MKSYLESNLMIISLCISGPSNLQYKLADQR